MSSPKWSEFYKVTELGGSWPRIHVRVIWLHSRGLNCDIVTLPNAGFCLRRGQVQGISTTPRKVSGCPSGWMRPCGPSHLPRPLLPPTAMEGHKDLHLEQSQSSCHGTLQCCLLLEELKTKTEPEVRRLPIYRSHEEWAFTAVLQDLQLCPPSRSHSVSPLIVSAANMCGHFHTVCQAMCLFPYSHFLTEPHNSPVKWLSLYHPFTERKQQQS